MSHTFNEFQRELIKRDIDPQNAYMFTLVYERLSECENQLTMCAKLVDELANALAMFTQLNENMQRDVQKLLRGSRSDGVDVGSVAFDPSEDDGR